MPDKTDLLMNVAALGVVAGMRSQLPLALLALAAAQRDGGHHHLPEILTSPKVTAFLLVNAAGEIVVDKLPIAPSRLIPGSLIVRTGVGALAGALLARGTELAPVPAAATGGLGALLGSYAGYHLRAGLVAATGIPDPLVAVLEDVTAVAIGSHAVGLQRLPGERAPTR